MAEQRILFRAEDKTGAATRSAKKNVDSLNKSTKQLGGSFSTLQKTLVGVGAALATGAFARSVIATSARFEDLRTSLSSVTGSAKEGEKAFAFVSKFATKTQFSVEDLSKTFIKLKAAGIEPTEELLTTFTDTAAITTDQIGSLEAVTDLFARTVGGGLGLEEIERLGDRGVPVLRILKKELGLSRDQISEFGKSAEGAKQIVDAFAKGMREEFGGATQNVLDNLSTKMSNFNIATDNAKDAIGQGGLTDALGDVIVAMTDAIVANDELFRSIGEALGNAVKATAVAFGFLADNIRIIKALGIAAIAYTATTAFLGLAKAIRSVGIAAIAAGRNMGKAGFLGVVLALVAGIAELTGLLDFLLDRFKGGVDPVDTYMKSLGRVSRELAKLNDAGDDAFDTLQNEGVNAVRALQYEQRQLNAQLALQEELLREFDPGTDDYNELQNTIEDTKQKIQDIDAAINDYYQAVMDVPPIDMGFIKVNEILVEQISLFEKLSRKSMEQYRKALSDLSDEKLFEKALTPTQKEKQALDQRLADIEEFKKRGLISEEEYQRRRQEIIFDSNNKIIDLARERRIKELQIDGMSRQNAEQLADFEKKTQIEKAQFILGSATESFQELGKINKQAFQAYKALAISQALIDTYASATAAFKALAPIPFVGPALGIAAAAAAIAAGMARVNAIRSQTYTGKQGGGPVGAGQTYLVGEAGPELFQTPAGGGMIIPNSQMGGAGVTVNFTVHAIDAQSFQGALVEQEDTIVGIINQAVTNTGREAITA